MKQKKSSIWGYRPFWRGILVAIGVIAILALGIKLLDFAANKVLEAMFPERVVEVPLSYVNQEVGVDVSSGVVLENWDDHGGFLGDGETFVKIQFSPENAADIEKTLSNTAGYIKGTFLPSMAEVLERCPQGAFPNAEHCLWKWKDRTPDSGGNNITLVLYEPQERILYYYEWDT